MLTLSRCSTALRWRLSLPCPALCFRSSSPRSVRPQAALFHQSNAKASPVPNKPPTALSSASGLDVDLFGMGMWSLGLGAVGAALAGIFLANTDLCLSKAAKASLEYLADADLRSTVDDEKVIKAQSLWEKNGAVVMAVRRPG
uniref:Uncharacterized protein n=2 Tax=Sphaeramia orbicularis TaxID=375764 RepID=A0A673BKE3_9TELE